MSDSNRPQDSVIFPLGKSAAITPKELTLTLNVDATFAIGAFSPIAQMYRAATALEARGFFEESSCADEMTGAEMAEMRAALAQLRELKA